GTKLPTKLDLSHCDATGHQIGWSYYMPLCAPVWHGGDNGGATMTGVTPTEIRYVFYAAKGDPQVNAILAREGLAASTEPMCERAEAKVIAQTLKPAYVMAPVAASSFYDELAYENIIVAGGEAEPASYHTQYPGRYYDVFMDGTRAADMMGEYWCKKLNGKPV